MRRCENPQELTEADSRAGHLDQSAPLVLTDALRSADRRSGAPTAARDPARVDRRGSDRAVGAAPHERPETRTTQRNGTRDEPVGTTTGDPTVKGPGLRTGPFLPSWLAPRRRIDFALHAVRRAGDQGISTSGVGRICAWLDGEAAALRPGR